MSAAPDRRSAEAVEAAFRVIPGLYLLGSLERGVTVYNQQLRAHNLAWALWELHKDRRQQVSRVAVVGGGVAGLTTAACFLCRFENTVSITLFEQLWDLCPLQQGSDGRWLHPRIYEWPAEGSRVPSAQLPVLNWTEGRASDVTRTIVQEFVAFCGAFAQEEQRLSVYLGLRNFKIDAKTNEIFWVANRATRAGPFFHLSSTEGKASTFDTIIVAAGFGLETRTPGYSTESYWRNEQIGQPILDGSQHRYLVSGFGDGALVDLCRLTIERFRQDTIVGELFQANLETVEKRFSDELQRRGRDTNTFELFREVEDELLGPAKEQLRNRIRKDTRVTLHLRGRNNEIKTFPQIFGRNSSFLHRLMTYLLYRCGAVAFDFSELANAVTQHSVPHTNVLCRYGADTMEHLHTLFTDPAIVSSRLAEMKEKQEQTPRLLSPPGTFPHYSTT